MPSAIAEEGVLIATQDFILEISEVSLYEVDVMYPVFGDILPEKVRNRFNKELKKLASTRVTKFKRDAAKAYEETKGKLPSDLMSTLNITVETVVANPGEPLVSFVYTDNRFLRGAERPAATDLFAVAYDTETQKKLTLASLFKPKSGYLKKISAYVKEDMQRQFDAEGLDEKPIKSGVSAVVKNFNTFALGQDAITFYFDTDKVASYETGTHLVSIPYEELRDIINPEGPLDFAVVE